MSSEQTKDARIKELETAIIKIANQLDAWAFASKQHGWSTHQVEPMKKEADNLRCIAVKR